MSLAEEDRRLVVAERADGAQGVVVLTLKDPAGADLPYWTPGSHIDLKLPPGVRQYSLCGDPEDRSSWTIGVLYEPDGRGGSAYVHDELQAGVAVDTRGPRNHFPLEPARRYVFIAGGIGITPILPMIRAADAAGSSWELLYGGRTAASMAFVDHLARHGDRVLLRPQDEHGLLDLATALPRPEDDDELLVYACGPEPLLAAIEAQCEGWPSNRLRVERFSAAPQDFDPEADTTIEVVLQESGLTIEVPAGTSILAAVEAAGIEVMCSCTEGICGTCETDVLEGVPDHRDSVLTEEAREAGDVMMICVSRAKTDRLVLDL